MIRRKRMTVRGLFVSVVLICAMGVAVIGIPPSSAEAQQTSLRIATSKEGTAGYTMGVGLAASVKRNLKTVSMEALPTPGSTASVKILAKRGADLTMASTWTLKDAYNNTGAFEKTPITRRPLQGWYYTTVNWVLITKKDRNDINSINDLVGKKFFPFVAGSGIFDVYRYVFKKMGIWDKMKIRQVGPMEASDALQMGTVDVLGAYTVQGGASTVSWVRNVDARIGIKVVLPQPEEKKIINPIPGITSGTISNKWMSPKNQKNNPSELWSWTLHYGYHPAPDISTDVMYNIYKLWIEKADSELKDISSTLKFYALGNPIDYQVNGIAEAKGIPVHPGVAKYLKEKGLWKDEWVIGQLDPGVK
jgi:uncharacterized protein